MIRLVQEFGAHTGRQFSFSQARIRLGRAPTNEVAFDPNVDLDASGNHCEIVEENGVYYVVDQNSRNGTWVNGNRVNRQRLGPNDVIECGRGGPRVRIELPQASPIVSQHPATAHSAFNSGTAATEAIPAVAGPAGFPPGTFGNPTPGPVSAYPPPQGSNAAAAGSPFAGTTPPVGTPFSKPSPGSPQPFQPAQAPFGGAPASATGPYAPVPVFNPLGSPPAGASGPFAPMNAAPPPPFGGPVPAGAPVAASASPYGPQAPGLVPPLPGQPMSAGSAAAAKLPPGASVGKRTMAMMIDVALAQAGVKKSNTGLKIAIVATLVIVVAGLGIGAYFIWMQKEETDQRLAQVSNGGGGGGEGSPGQRIARANEAAIYMLAAVQPGGMPQGFCTGFAVTQDLIATNAHCVDVAQEMITQRGRTIVALRNNGRGVQVPVQPVYRDPRFRNASLGLEGSGYDVGIMRSAVPLPVQVRLASYQQATQLQPGAQIYVFGFPGLTMNEVSPVATITEGILNRMTDFFDRAADDPSLAQKIQHSAQTTSGSSGSPIFQPSGEVIGINAGSLSDAEHQNIVDPTTGRRVSVEVSRSSNFKYGMRADLIRAAVQSVGENAP